MMAPKYERARLLHEAIQFAVARFDEPIEQVRVRPKWIEVGTCASSIRLRYAYENAYSPEGSAMPGGGSWSVWPIEEKPVSSILRLLRRK